MSYRIVLLVPFGAHQYHAAPVGVTQQRCGLLPKYVGHFLFLISLFSMFLVARDAIAQTDIQTESPQYSAGSDKCNYSHCQLLNRLI